MDADFELAFNPVRVRYLLSLYSLSVDDFLSRVGSKRLTREVFDGALAKQRITLSLLKKIDALFDKGLNWYGSNRVLPEPKSASIFFRKDRFNSELNFAAKKLTNDFEEKKFEVQTLCGFVNFRLERPKKYSLRDDARVIALEYRSKFSALQADLLAKKIISKPCKEYDVLKNHTRLAEGFGAFVFEFVENWNTKEKTDFNGFFMAPNFIVIKRQRHYRRELFTLMHEFAHFLLNIEEIDNLPEDINHRGQTDIERWCNDFAYHFLIGDHHQTIMALSAGTSKNHHHRDVVQTIYDDTFLSYSAIYTRMYLNNKLARNDYDRIISEINETVVREELRLKTQRAEERALLKEQGKSIKGGMQKPLPSHLLKEVAKLNYFRGNIDDSQLCGLLNIKPDRIEREIYS